MPELPDLSRYVKDPLLRADLAAAVEGYAAAAVAALDRLGCPPADRLRWEPARFDPPPPDGSSPYTAPLREQP